MASCSSFARLGCKIAGHERRGRWKYVEDGSCEQEGRCQRCFCVLQKLEKHVWGPWNIEAKPCEHGHYCHRCFIISKEHIWGPWQYINNSNCIEERRCGTCKYGIERREVHDFEYL